jgi:hypothetical protein
MAKYGMIFDTSDIKSQLAQANRDYYGRKVWENLYGSIDYAKQKQLGKLQQDYSSAVNEAYASAYLANQNIAASNLGVGYKAAASEANDLALEEAYNTYRQKYLAGVSEVESLSAKQTQNVTNALDEQAKYESAFAEKPYEYLKYVFDKYSEGERANNIFYNEELWKRYTKEVKDEAGNPTGERELKSWEEIANYGAYEEVEGKKQWIGLFDHSGNLTIKGVDFYDQMINQLAYEGRGISFAQWLSGNDEKLYEWSRSYNPYNYTEAGTNLGSFKTMVGLTSADEKYTFMERFGGLSKSDVNNMYSGFTNKLNELNKKISSSSGKDAKQIASEFTGLTAEIGKLTKQLGITADVENELGMSLDDLGKYLANNASAAVSNGDIWLQGVQTALTSIGSGAVIGAKAGGGKGAIAGAIVGAIVGSAFAALEAEGTKDQNKKLAKASRDAYDNLVTTLITYSQNKQREAQINYYKK